MENKNAYYKVEKDHTIEEYRKKYGEQYDNGNLWDFSVKDFEGGAVEPTTGMIYWKIKDENGEVRYFETDESLEANNVIDSDEASLLVDYIQAKIKRLEDILNDNCKFRKTPITEALRESAKGNIDIYKKILLIVKEYAAKLIKKDKNTTTVLND